MQPKPGGAIYAIGAEGTALVKIGATRGTVAQRLKQLQTGSAHRLRVVAMVDVQPNLKRIERHIHQFLMAERQRGEWFDVPMDHTQLAAMVMRAVQYIAEQEESARRRQQEQEAAKRNAILALPSLPTIGERVKTAREQRGIHQAELARRLGCSVNALSMLEKNAITDPRSSRIIGIAEALGVSADYLLVAGAKLSLSKLVA